MKFYKRWLLSTLTIFLLLIITYILLSLIIANGKIDQLYLKVATPKQSSLVLGTSRASIGIMPQIFNESDLSFEKPLFNFGFTFPVSPYGPYYLKAIKAKLDPDTKNGIFLLEVNPGSLSFDRTKGDEVKNFREKGMLLDTIKSVDKKPNIDYLINHYYDPYYKIFIRNLYKGPYLVHNDGWLEVTCPIDDFNIKRRSREIVKKYATYLKSYYKLSEIRIDYFKQTINLLNKHGRVFLVRLPVSKEMYDAEIKYMAHFDSVLENIAAETGCHYLNLAVESGNHLNYDGHHLYKTTAPKVNEKILTFIKEKINN